MNCEASACRFKFLLFPATSSPSAHQMLAELQSLQIKNIQKLILVHLLQIFMSAISLIFILIPQQASAQEAQTETVDDIRTKTRDLINDQINNREQLLLRDLDRIEIEIARVTAGSGRTKLANSTKSSMDELIKKLSNLADTASNIDCQTSTDIYNKFVYPYSSILNNIIKYANDDRIDLFKIGILIPSGPNIDKISACSGLKERFGSAIFKSDFTEVMALINKNLNEWVAEQASITSEYEKYLVELKKRRASVQDKINSIQSATQISGQLPLLLAIVAGACVATILGIKLFGEELQMEWVASGQVIQFVTVMILLSVILALGLSKFLQENTLGTLLGGLAGYVLAQGVGRAATREAIRQQTTSLQNAQRDVQLVPPDPRAPPPPPSPPTRQTTVK